MAASVQQLLQPLGGARLQCSRWLWLFGARIRCPPVKEAAHRCETEAAGSVRLAACKSPALAELHTGAIGCCYAPLYGTLTASDRLKVLKCRPQPSSFRVLWPLLAAATAKQQCGSVSSTADASLTKWIQDTEANVSTGSYHVSAGDRAAHGTALKCVLLNGRKGLRQEPHQQPSLRY